MESLYFLVPCALVFLALAIKALFWAINSGQYDNLDTEAHRILFDADAKKAKGTTAAEVALNQVTASDASVGEDQPQDKVSNN